MSVDAIVFIIVTAGIVLYFAARARARYLLARRARGATRAFLIGKAGLLGYIAAFNGFWIIFIIASPFLREWIGIEWTRHIATAILLALGITAVITEHKWWGDITRHMEIGLTEVSGKNRSDRSV